jgi:hypothetical protein
MSINDSTFIECECHSQEHTLKYSINVEDKTIYTSVFLDQYQPWYGRAWTALKYLFGYKCKYGHFDCTLMGPEKIDQLKSLIKTYDELCFPKGNQPVEEISYTTKNISVNDIKVKFDSEYIEYLSYESVIYISGLGFKHPPSRVTYVRSDKTQVLMQNEHVLLEDGMKFIVEPGALEDLPASLKFKSDYEEDHYQ